MDNERFEREILDAHLPPVPIPGELVGAAEVAGLDEPVRRYFHFMRVVGRPRVRSFRCYWTGRFRMSPSAPFRACEAWQYDSAGEIARFFRMRVRMAPLVWVVAHDSYLRGRGRMLVKLFDRFPVVDARGPELDTGELVTWLNDAVLIAPSMLLDGRVSFRGLDDHTFVVALAHEGTVVSARVLVDDRGAPVDFRSTDRFLADPADEHRPWPERRWLRCEWRTPIAGWTESCGHPLPTLGEATWMLPAGPFTYVELALIPDSLAFNVQP